MLKLNLKMLLLAKGIEEPLPWLTSLGINKGVAHRLLHNKQQKVDRKHMYLICLHAHCTPNDLFFVVPDAKTKLPTDHPLQQLLNPALPNLIGELKGLSPAQMRKLKKLMDDMKKE